MIALCRQVLISRDGKHASALATTISPAVHASRQDGGVVALRTIHVERHDDFSNRLGRRNHDT
jgi:hypothetical protein